MGDGMKRAWGRYEMYTKIWSGNLKGRDNPGELDIDGKIISK
jgi:hypothetical protein